MSKFVRARVLIPATLLMGAAIAFLFLMPMFAADGRSVELDLAELSPNGEAGGYAIPASGNSVCSLSLSPSTITQGGSANMYWSWDHPEAWQLTHMYVNGPSANSVIVPGGGTAPNSSSLAPGQYTYTIWNNIPDGDHDGDGFGGTVYVECSATLTVKAAPVPDPVKPNLVSRNLAKVGGGTTISSGVPVSFTAQVHNIATDPTAGASNFWDVFRWYDEQAAQWKIFAYVDRTQAPTAGLGPNSHYNDTSSPISFTNSPQTPGWVHIDHCVDSSSAVVESNEYDNCSTMITLTISASQPDLISENLAMVGGGTEIEVGHAASFTANVRNTGTSVGAFGDTFLYSMNGDAFALLTNVGKSSLGTGASSVDTSGTIAPGNTGILTIRHCVDYYNAVINESSEVNNCTDRSYPVVQGSIQVSCSVNPNPADIGESVTWSASATGGTGPYSYQWSGGGTSGTSATFARSYSTAGAYIPQVIAQDTLGRQGTVICPALVVGTSPISASIFASLAGEGDWSGSGLDIGLNDQVDIRWEGGGAATSCAGDSYYSTGGAVSGTKAAAQVSQAPATAGATRTYRVTCSGGGNSASDSVTVTRASTTTPPSLTVSPTRVRQGETTHVTATLNGHTGCVITGRDINPSGTDKNTRNLGGTDWDGNTGPILGETTYRLTCSSGGNDEATAYILPIDVQN